MNKKWIDIIGLGALIVSFVAELVGDWADEKSTEELIDEKLDERGIPRRRN